MVAVADEAAGDPYAVCGHPFRYRVEDHHARVSSEHHFLGYTRRETPVYIDRRYWEADIKVTTGFIEPHLMAGFSGGRKLIAPGCAGEMTIKALHSPLFLEDPRCREGCIEGNPLHQELRTGRNRNLIRQEEQDTYYQGRVAVLGLSVVAVLTLGAVFAVLLKMSTPALRSEGFLDTAYRLPK